MAAHQQIRRALEARLDKIVNRVGKIEADLRRSHDRDWTEQAIEVENDEVLEGLDDMNRAEARQLLDALRRIQAGRYGFCGECGEPIADERLEALPFATTCIVCAKS
jgi:DnaK suppressor protein